MVPYISDKAAFIFPTISGWLSSPGVSKVGSINSNGNISLERQDGKIHSHALEWKMYVIGCMDALCILKTREEPERWRSGSAV
jgi:hypothetical protein